MNNPASKASPINGKTVALAVAALVGLAIVFFWWNPFREGEITLAMPDGTSMTLKVANSNEIGDLIRQGLQHEKTAGPLTSALVDIIENLPAGNPLGERLMDLAERRRPPFFLPSIPVKLVYGANVPEGMVGVCEHSDFKARNLVVFVLSSDEEMLHRFPLYADRSLTFPCPSEGETLRVNLADMERFNRHMVLAKRCL